MIQKVSILFRIQKLQKRTSRVSRVATPQLVFTKEKPQLLDDLKLKFLYIRVYKNWKTFICQQTNIRQDNKNSGQWTDEIFSTLSISSINTSGLEVPVALRHCTIFPGIAPTYVRRCPFTNKIILQPSLSAYALTNKINENTL